MLTAVAVPSFRVALLRARAVEPRTILPAIAELTYRRDHGQYLACPAGPDEAVPRTGVRFVLRDCWKQLGVNVGASAPTHALWVQVTTLVLAAVAVGVVGVAWLSAYGVGVALGSPTATACS